MQTEPTPSPVLTGPDLPLITQSVIALFLVGTLCYMMIAQIAVPELLIGIVGLVVGYYFGTRQAASILRGQAQAVNAVITAAYVR